MWLTLSVAWIGVATYTNYFNCGWYRSSKVCFNDLLPFDFDVRLIWVIGPPIIAIILGVVIAWCANGFRQISN